MAEKAPFVAPPTDLRGAWNSVIDVHRRVWETSDLPTRVGASVDPRVLDRLADRWHGPAAVFQPFCGMGTELMKLTSVLPEGSSGIGVDISDAAIVEALRLSRVLSLEARVGFIRADILSWLESAPTYQCDIVFISQGSLWWIKDIAALFGLLRRCANEGAILVLAEFHPLLLSIETLPDHLRDYPGLGAMVGPRYHAGGILPYMSDLQHVRFDAVSAVEDYPHSVSEIVTALSRSGWTIENMYEYETVYQEHYAPKIMEPIDNDYFGLRAELPRFPLTLHIWAGATG